MLYLKKNLQCPPPQKISETFLDETLTIRAIQGHVSSIINCVNRSYNQGIIQPTYQGMSKKKHLRELCDLMLRSFVSLIYRFFISVK